MEQQEGEQQETWREMTALKRRRRGREVIGSSSEFDIRSYAVEQHGATVSVCVKDKCMCMRVCFRSAEWEHH